jgi:hypothetical protein
MYDDLVMLYDTTCNFYYVFIGPFFCGEQFYVKLQYAERFLDT